MRCRPRWCRLTEAVGTAAHDAHVRLLVLSGAGRHFCTGFDLSDLDRETDDSLLARFTRVELLLQAVHAPPRLPRSRWPTAAPWGPAPTCSPACTRALDCGDASFAFPGAGFGLVLAPRA